MNKRIKKKYTDRVRALVTWVWHESSNTTDVFPDSIIASGKAFKRCWGWMRRRKIFIPVCESVSQCQQGGYYSIALTETRNGAALYASVIKHEGLK